MHSRKWTKSGRRALLAIRRYMALTFCFFRDRGIFLGGKGGKRRIENKWRRGRIAVIFCIFEFAMVGSSRNGDIFAIPVPRSIVMTGVCSGFWFPVLSGSRARFCWLFNERRGKAMVFSHRSLFPMVVLPRQAGFLCSLAGEPARLYICWPQL